MPAASRQEGRAGAGGGEGGQRPGAAIAGRDSGTPEQRRDKGGSPGGKRPFPPAAGRHNAGRTVQDAAGAQRPPLFRSGRRGIPASGRATDPRCGSASAGLVGSHRSLLTVCAGRRHPAGWRCFKGAYAGPEKWPKGVLSCGPRASKAMPRRHGHGGDRRRPARRPSLDFHGRLFDHRKGYAVIGGSLFSRVSLNRALVPSMTDLSNSATPTRRLPLVFQRRPRS